MGNALVQATLGLGAVSFRSYIYSCLGKAGGVVLRLLAAGCACLLSMGSSRAHTASFCPFAPQPHANAFAGDDGAERVRGIPPPPHTPLCSASHVSCDSCLFRALRAHFRFTPPVHSPPTSGIFVRPKRRCGARALCDPLRSVCFPSQAPRQHQTAKGQHGIAALSAGKGHQGPPGCCLPRSGVNGQGGASGTGTGCAGAAECALPPRGGCCSGLRTAPALFHKNRKGPVPSHFIAGGCLRVVDVWAGQASAVPTACHSVHLFVPLPRHWGTGIEIQ